MRKYLPFLALLLLSNFLCYSQLGIINQVTDCDTNCSDLSINFPQIAETTSYDVVSIPFSPPAGFLGLRNQLFVNTDDIWSGIINIPFDFNFFGDDYNQIIIGANGVLSFDVSNANGFNNWAFNQPIPNNSNNTLSDANIFWAGHDIDPNASNGTHEIGWEIVGNAPFRAVVISAYNVSHFSAACNNLKTTQMLMLYETTNVIEVYILDKPTCFGWNGGNAVIGIQNNVGTVAYVPPGRNTGNWSTSIEAWQFNPSGFIIDNIYSWYDGDNVLISSDSSINECPTETTTYTGEVEYVNVGIGNVITLSETITLYVDVISTNPTPLITCDYLNANDGLALFDLTDENEEILNGSNPNDFLIVYFETQADAEARTNAITYDYYNIIPYTQTVFARVENVHSFCYEIVSFELDVQYCPVACGEFASVTYCYVDNDTTEFIFSSADSTPLTVVFNSGQVEDGVDFLSVIDSDGVTDLNASSPYGNNGDLSGLIFTSTGSSILVKINSDDNTISCDSENYTPWDFDVYCADSVGLIRVNAFLDANEDAIFDTNESLFNNGVFTYEVNNNGVIHSVSTSSGSFIIPNFDESNTYDIGFTVYAEYQSCLNQTINLFENITVLHGDLVILDFPLTEIALCSDIGVYLISLAPPRPGQVNHVGLVIENHGETPVSGSVEFTHDDLVALDNVYYVDSGNSITNTANGFILDFYDLLPNRHEYVVIKFVIPTTLNLGDLLTHSVVYNETDLVLENNTSTLTEEVVDSYDPNDKAESHGGKIQFDGFTESDYLYYTIRFQNLGTADALNIRIEDVLDSQLNESSFKMLASSHPCMVTRVDNNLTWQFNNVNLPPESVDEPGSHGFVYFKIKLNSGFSVGDIIPNTADIYFDFNDAIVTNTFETEFVANLSVDEFISNAFSMYPNPANAVINIRFNNNIGNSLLINIYDIQGKLILTNELTLDSNKVQLDVSELSSGMYFVKMQSEQFIATQKIIIE